MECGINFRSPDSQVEYFAAYEKSMQLFCIEVQEEYVHTEFGESHVIKAGNQNNPPLVLLHAASFGSPIWYKNFEELSKYYSLYAIDLIGETSKSLMKKKMQNPGDNAIELRCPMRADRGAGHGGVANQNGWRKVKCRILDYQCFGSGCAIF